MTDRTYENHLETTGDRRYTSNSQLHCPKHRDFLLEKSAIADNLPTYACPHCHGHWVSSDDYERWQQEKGWKSPSPDTVVENMDLEFESPSHDKKAGLCPDCQRYLSRAKIPIKKPFFVERCPSCNGIWLDAGEWNALTQLGLVSGLEKIFSSEWQTNLREKQQAEKERDATIKKLGPELAEKLFEIADLLENHPEGEFGVAYLMRRFDKQHQQ
ncbi:zf-TFIIB domain-containing protein [Geitlerinema sp. PCC 9228]|jgi:Zn-finger nucleic acid-binding protein|uniref:zf-TFIIB domain-containing protein n=1 Tax=Geitlerinema sp. PCC 9228 TaxID=111611 RepID=UPI0009FF49A4|nr:zf-TFIIB domain-containing protein [Geitlerinema sp. PCC 9228]